MSVLIFVGGAALGAALMAAHSWEKARALEALRRRYEAEAVRMRRANAGLRAECWKFKAAWDCADAYRCGLERGRNRPYTPAERFVHAFEGRKAQFRVTGGERR